LRPYDVSEAAFDALKACYQRHWSAALTERRTGPRKSTTSGTIPADDVRKAWLAERSEVLTRHNLPITLPVFEGMQSTAAAILGRR
jgi:hypothetical protein